MILTYFNAVNAKKNHPKAQADYLIRSLFRNARPIKNKNINPIMECNISNVAIKLVQ